MALVAQEIPKVGLVMENARLVRWLKEVGDPITAGEPLLELETEKSVVEIEATVSGRLAEKLVEVDQEAKVGDRVAWVESDTDTAAEAPAAAPAAIASADTATPSSAPSERGAAAARDAPDATVSAKAPGQGVSAGSGRAALATAANPATLNAAPAANGAAAGVAPNAFTPSSNGIATAARIRSSPVARKVAAQNGVDLSTLTGTGPQGRIQLVDVRKALEARSAQRPQSAGGQIAIELSGMRRALARTMTLSNATVPQFIVERAVDWTSLHAVRTAMNAKVPAGAPKPSVNDFLLAAVARSLLAFPALNATFSGDPDSPDARILQASGAHVGLVVAVDNGLLVPVIHDVETLSVPEIARRRSDSVERALKGRLKREELEGATFSISNLGARGPDRFTAIINPPQSAILAVGRQRDCVVALSGGIQVRPMSDLALTVDHRVADGRLAADFLAYLVEILEGDEWRAA